MRLFRPPAPRRATRLLALTRSRHLRFPLSDPALPAARRRLHRDDQRAPRARRAARRHARLRLRDHRLRRARDHSRDPPRERSPEASAGDPAPPVTYLSAVLASTLLVVTLQALALVAIGGAFYDARVPANVGSLILALLLGAAALAALGVAIASLIRSAEGSSAVVNTIVLPMAFISGSFGPTRHYPSFLRALAAVLPLKYVIELVNTIYLSHQQIWSRPGALGVIAAWGAAGLVALRAFRWEPKER